LKRAAMVAVASLAVVTAACGGTKEARREVAATEQMMADRHEGVVASVEENWIAVTSPERPKDPPVRFVVDESTEIRMGEEMADRTAIEEGEVVRVSYESRDGAEAARRIEILQGDEADRVKAKAAKAAPTWPKPERMAPPSMHHMH
jgi:hypothetical protein